MKAAATAAPAEEAVVAASATTTTPEAVNVPPADAKSLGSEENKEVAKTEDVIEKKEDAAALKNTISSSFKEESNFIADLKESEKKALQDFKEKIEALIKSNGFALPPPTSVEVVPPKTAAAAEETSETKEVEVEATVTAEQAPVAEALVEKTTPAAAPEAEAAAAAVETTAAAASEVVEAPVETTTTQAPEVEAPAVENTTPTPEVEDPALLTPTAPEEEEKEDISLWGVPLSESKGDERTNVILLKFLRARDFKVDEACTMLVNTIRWRKSFFKAGTEEEEQQEAVEENSSELDSFFYMQGSDKEHHPVCYNNWGAFQDKDLYNKTFGDATKIQNFVRWRVRVLEKGIKQLDFVPGGHSAILQVNDVKNMPLLKKEMRGVIIGFITLLQDNYPELVVKNVFVNTPWYFSALYSVISPFITQRMKRKIVLARPGQIFKSIAPENVPVQYGGFAQPNDTAFAGVKYSVEQLSIKAGEKESIEIVLEQAGSTAVWDLSVIGWDISYGVEFAPTATESYHSIIEKTRKIVSVEEPIRTTFKCVEPGKLVLSIDNTASRKKKLVVYRFKVTAAPSGVVTTAEL
ncbi:unnamed protein product [Sphagnum balticum]